MRAGRNNRVAGEMMRNDASAFAELSTLKSQVAARGLGAPNTGALNHAGARRGKSQGARWPPGRAAKAALAHVSHRMDASFLRDRDIGFAPRRMI